MANYDKPLKVSGISDAGAMNVMCALLEDISDDIRIGIRAMYGVFGKKVSYEEWNEFYKNRIGYKNRPTNEESVLVQRMENYFSAKEFFEDDPYQALGGDFSNQVEKTAFDKNLESTGGKVSQYYFDEDFQFDIQKFVLSHLSELKERFYEYIK